MEDEEYDTFKRAMEQMHQDFHGHVREVRADVAEYASALDAHLEAFAKHEVTEAEWHANFIEAQKLNTEAIQVLAKSTEGLVEAWNTTNSIGKFIKWAAGIAIAVAAIIKIVGI